LKRVRKEKISNRKLEGWWRNKLTEKAKKEEGGLRNREHRGTTTR
jgi:CRISPR/Cas system-associated protein Cas7 (RAMP superfamily)